MIPCRQSFLHLAALAVIAASVSAIVGIATIDRSPIFGDGRDHLAAALNLINYGVFGSGTAPDMWREPGNAAAIAVMLKVLDLTHHTVEELSNPRHLLPFRIYNLVWIGATLLILLLMVIRRSGSWILCFLLSSIFAIAFSGVPRLINRLNAEPLSMFLFAVAALLMASLVTHLHDGKPYRAHAMLLGVILGLAALVWAQALYIGTIAVLLACGYLVVRRANTRMKVMIAFTITMLVQVSVILPWVYRNVATFGTPAISGRASSVVFVRILEAREMTVKEVPCVFYAFSPPALRNLLQPVIGVETAEFQPGARCVRFGRELNFDTGDRFRSPPSDNDMAAIAQGKPDIADRLFYRAYIADQIASANGKSGWSLIPRDPWTLYKYVVTAPLFIYRGIWSTGPWFLAATLFIAFIWQGVFLFRVVFLLPILSHLFHSLATHNLPRYHLVELPFWCLALALTCAAFLPKRFIPSAQESQSG